MVTYKLIEDTAFGKIYEYYPEGKTEFPGRVAIFKRGEGKILSLSEKDFGGGYYAYRVIRGVNFDRVAGTIAWF